MYAAILLADIFEVLSKELVESSSRYIYYIKTLTDLLFAKPFKLFPLVFRLFYKVWRPFSGDEIRSSSSRLVSSSSCSRHFGFQKKRTVKCGPLNWPIIPHELNGRYDNRTYLELNSINIPTFYITLSLTIWNFFSTRSRNLTCTCGRPAKLLIVYWLLVLVHIRTRQNDGRISPQKTFQMVKGKLL